MAVSALEAIQVIEQQHADASHQLRVLKMLSQLLQTRQMNHFIRVCVE